MKAPTFIDRVQIHVRAGGGGNGVATFRREKYIPYGGPDGGDGGRGGDVILVGDKDVDSLLHLYYQPNHRAQPGENGRGKQQYGHAGADCIVKVPCGTEVRDLETDEWIGEVLEPGQQFVVAKGGKGGLGNMHFKTSTHQAPRECTPGVEGEERRLRLELKLISDIGLVGFPNAGKSTLIGRVSHARPKVAAYPFTTLHPNIGIIDYEDYRTLRIADIPGLIAGAHQGVGLGHDFLRHIERTRFLVLLIDMSGTDARHPADDYFSLRRELELYSRDLAEREFITVANKMDVPEARQFLSEFVARTGVTPMEMSAANGDGIDAFKAVLAERLLPRVGTAGEAGVPGAAP
jgi:GTP-binding protein